MHALQSYRNIFHFNAIYYAYWTWFFDDECQEFHDNDIVDRILEQCRLYHLVHNDNPGVNNGRLHFLDEEALRRGFRYDHMKTLLVDCGLNFAHGWFNYSTTSKVPKVHWHRFFEAAKGYMAISRNIGGTDARRTRLFRYDVNHILGLLWADFLPEWKIMSRWISITNRRLTELLVLNRGMTTDMVNASIVNELMKDPFARAGFFNHRVSYYCRHYLENLDIWTLGRESCIYDGHSEELQRLFRDRDAYDLLNVKRFNVCLFLQQEFGKGHIDMICDIAPKICDYADIL